MPCAMCHTVTVMWIALLFSIWYIFNENVDVVRSTSTRRTHTLEPSPPSIFWFSFSFILHRMGPNGAWIVANNKQITVCVYQRRVPRGGASYSDTNVEHTLPWQRTVKHVEWGTSRVPTYFVCCFFYHIRNYVIVLAVDTAKPYCKSFCVFWNEPTVKSKRKENIRFWKS